MKLRKFATWTGYAAAGLVALVLAAVVAALGWRAVAQEANARSRAITSPHGIDELRKVRIGGIDQWIHIRGENVANPILLYVHGGPGNPMMPYERHFQTPLERDFTVVQWDQRGAGKTYVSNGGDAIKPTLTFDRMKADTHELTAYLKQRFKQPKIFMLGHSWGSILGLPVALEKPENYYAFIGTGVVVDFRQEGIGYQHVLREARQRGDREAIAALEAIAPYPDPQHGTRPINGVDRERVLLDYLVKYGYFTTIAKLGNSDELLRYELALAIDSPEYSLRDLASFFTVGPHLNDALYKYMDRHDVRSLGMQTSLPVIFVEGNQDWQTPWPIAKRYIDDLASPYKAFYLMPNAAHAGPVDRPELFAEILRKKVRPLAFGQYPPLDAAPRACRSNDAARKQDSQSLDLLGC
jgi:pimeloyl-ACP methyl ester carboxylesterase